MTKPTDKDVAYYAQKIDSTKLLPPKTLRIQHIVDGYMHQRIPSEDWLNYVRRIQCSALADEILKLKGVTKELNVRSRYSGPYDRVVRTDVIVMSLHEWNQYVKELKAVIIGDVLLEMYNDAKTKYEGVDKKLKALCRKLEEG